MKHYADRPDNFWEPLGNGWHLQGLVLHVTKPWSVAHKYSQQGTCNIRVIDEDGFALCGVVIDKTLDTVILIVSNELVYA